jgi:hypothetical protein
MLRDGLYRGYYNHSYNEEATKDKIVSQTSFLSKVNLYYKFYIKERGIWKSSVDKGTHKTKASGTYETCLFSVADPPSAPVAKKKIPPPLWYFYARRTYPPACTHSRSPPATPPLYPQAQPHPRHPQTAISFSFSRTPKRCRHPLLAVSRHST